jgi:hypothetical protein
MPKRSPQENLVGAFQKFASQTAIPAKFAGHITTGPGAPLTQNPTDRPAVR